MRATAAIPALLAAAAAAGCANLFSGRFGDAAADVAEFFGRDRPGYHAGRLAALHDPGTFRHVPDVPDTYRECVATVRILEEADYGTWHEVGAAVEVLTRVAVEDPSAYGRGGGIRALAGLGSALEASEDPPAGKRPAPDEVRGLLEDLRSGAPAGPDRAGLFGTVGDLVVPLPADPGPAGLLPEIRDLRGLLGGVLEASRPDAGRAAAARAHRALVNLGAQVVRAVLAQALLRDPDARVRRIAADALAEAPAPALAEILTTAFREERDEAVRRRVVAATAALGRASGGPARGRAVTVLIASLGDDVGSIRRDARDALAGLAGEDLGPGRDPWIQWWAVNGAER